MAVIQISKIQIRRGLQENLPTVLASAEMGWSVDTRRLYIGNGTLVEGAPSVGNTEILTQYTDIVSVVKTYSFKGDESGYTSITGPSALAPTTRTLQHKLDEFISVKDFGATGDGSTDDTAAIQRAFDQTYPVTLNNSTPAVRRVIHFPAGQYLLTSTVNIPSYASVIGDGVDGTIITQQGTFDLFAFSDSLGQTGLNFGLNSATPPKNIEVTSMTLQTNSANDVITVDSVIGISFTRVKFLGSVTTPSTVGSGTSGIRTQDTIGATTTINIQQCTFTNLNYGVYASGNTQQLVIDTCYFYNVYQGVTGTTYLSTTVPVAVRIKSSLFDKITSRAINFNSGSSMVSAYNYFKDAGNGLLGGGNPASSIIYFEGPNNYSFGDSFDRNDADAAIFLRIQTAASLLQTVTTVTASGTLKTTPGTIISLLDNSSGNTGLVLSTTITSAIIDYAVSRSATSRIGTIKYTQNSGSVIFEDDYAESGVTGTALAFTTYGGNVNLTYTTTSTGANVSLNYQVRRFTSV